MTDLLAAVVHLTAVCGVFAAAAGLAWLLDDGEGT